MRLFTPRPTLSDGEIRNGLRWMVFEGAASIGFGSITGSGFLAAYALILGANNLQIGFLAALPFIGQPMQIPLIMLVERLKRRKLLAFSSWVVAQIIWVPIALIPVFINIPSASSVSALMLLVALRSVLSAMTNLNLQSWTRDLVPQPMRGRFVSRRLMFGTLFSIVFGLGSGVFVDLWGNANGAALGYTVVLLFGTVFIGMASPIFMMLVPEPLMQPSDSSHLTIVETLLMPLHNKNFRTLMRFFLFSTFARNLAVPFFAVYMLQRIGLPLTTVMILTVLSQLANVLFLRIWGPMVDRLGGKVILSLCSSLFFLATLGWTFTTLPDRYWLTLPLLVILHVFVGIASAGINVATGMLNMKLAPKGNTMPYLVGGSLSASIGGALGPLLGGRFADFFSVRSLNISIEWIDPTRTVQLPAFSLTGYDFLFALAVVLGVMSFITLSRVEEEGETNKDIVLDELMSGASDMSRSMSSVPGLRYVTQFPYSYIRYVPGMDVAVGVTAYQIASSTRAAADAVNWSMSSSQDVARSVSIAVSDVTHAVGDVGSSGTELAIHAARGAVNAFTSTGGNASNLVKGSVIGTTRVLVDAVTDSPSILRASVLGAVRGAYEADADLESAVYHVVEGAREIADEIGLTEDDAVQEAIEGVREAVRTIGEEEFPKVSDALDSELIEGLSAPGGKHDSSAGT